MKKVLYILVFVLFVTTPVFAEDYSNLNSGSFTTNFTLGGTTDETLTVGMSNEVRGLYRIESGATQPQWFAIATYHIGGNNVYGTAQDITNIFKLTDGKEPGSEFTWSGLPEDSTASNEWSSGVWEAL